MAQAGCPGGCGVLGSLKSVTSHMGGCPDYARKFAAGEDMPSPQEMARNVNIVRPARVSRPKRPEVSVPPAIVPVAVEGPKTEERVSRKAPPVRVAQPVYVERWDVPQSF